MLRRLRFVHADQRGLTLVEMLIAIVLVGIITSGITMTVSHVMLRSSQTRYHMTAVRQVQSAGYWLSRDALQAQKMTAPDTSSEYPPGTNFPLTLEWKWDDTDTIVIYYITTENRLQRNLTVITNGEVTRETTSLVAEHIDANIDQDGDRRTRITLPATEGATAVFRVTATVAGQSETRDYEARPRPDAPNEHD